MKIERIKVFHFPASRSARVLWAAYETDGCEVEIENVDLYQGAHYAPEYLARNLNHSVPTVDIVWENGAVQSMIESAAIVQFLADAYPIAKLAPPAGATPERSDYLQMIHFCGTQMDMMLWQIRVHEHLLPAAERDPRVVERYRAKFKAEAEPQLAERLKRQTYICGSEFTAADCLLGHNVTWARGYGLCRDEIFRQYISRVSKRPAFVRAFADARTFRFEPPASREGPNLFNG